MNHFNIHNYIHCYNICLREKLKHTWAYKILSVVLLLTTGEFTVLIVVERIRSDHLHSLILIIKLYVLLHYLQELFPLQRVKWYPFQQEQRKRQIILVYIFLLVDI